jgi:endo-1,4-beta-mannosidase
VYKDDPTIAMWLMFGEPKAPSAHGMSSTQYVAAFKTILGQAQARDSNHIISTGGFLHLNGATPYPWQQIMSLPENDFCSIHTYSLGDQNDTIPKVSQYCSSINKPWLQEEFGATQAQGDWTPCTYSGYCGDERRADTFQRVYDVSRTANAAGALFWNLGVEVQGVNHTGDTYDVNPDTPLIWEVVKRNAGAP